jgi:hypothetical protein
MFRKSYLLVIQPNQSRHLELQELRHSLYRDFGCVSALAFEPVVPLLSSASPIPKESLLSVARRGNTAPLELSFDAARIHRHALFFPLASPTVWEEVRGRILRGPRAPEEPAAPVPAFPGIFIADADEIPQDSGGALSTPRSWRSYKLALYRMGYPDARGPEWWNGCRWYAMWELSVRSL